MGKVKELDNAFKSNYHGIVDHDGCIKVAKYDTLATIKYINILDGKIHDVLVKGKKNYTCKIHKDLQDVIMFLQIGDNGFVKFRKGEAWLVGFKKSEKNSNSNLIGEGDLNLLEYFQEQKRLSDVYDSGVSL